MKKVLIATFSQTGTTKKISIHIGKGIVSSGWEVTHHNISENDFPDIRKYDVIGIGTPTYFFRPPYIVMDFVENLNLTGNKASFVFITQGTHKGDCGNWIRRKLKEKGSRDLGYFHSFGADYWIGYIKRGVLFSPDSPNKTELADAEKFGEKIASRFKLLNSETESYDPPTPPVYTIERVAVDRRLTKLIYCKTFWADSKCDNCGVCIKKCPVNNIRERENGKLKWKSKCILCGTCELSCPKDAIHSALDWMIFATFMNYNIRQSKNKGIPFVKVNHSKGKTIVV